MPAGVPPDSGLLDPKHDPETVSEAASQEQQRRDRAWLEDRPPHYEDR